MKRLIVILYWFLIAHVIISVTFILDPPFLASTSLSRIYKTYFLPGPFFAEARIMNNYTLLLSWKIEGKWMPAINPAKENLSRYQASLNPVILYRSRLDRAMYLKLTVSDSTLTESTRQKELQRLSQYLHDCYVPKEADSICMVIINKRAKNFQLRTDTIRVFVSP